MTNYYEVKNPYHAVIKANHEDEVLQVYEIEVSDVEADEKDSFFDDMEVISEEETKKQLTNCIDNATGELLTQEQQKEIIESESPSLIIMELP